MINTLHNLDDLPSTAGTQPSIYDSGLLDKMYERMMKGPYRMLQAMTENLFNNDHHHRIVFLSKQIPSSQATARSLLEELYQQSHQYFLNRLIEINSASNSSLIVSTIIRYADESIVEGFLGAPGTSLERRKQVMAASWNQLVANNDPSMSQSSIVSSASLPAKAILHALCSTKPRKNYSIY